MTGMEHYKKRLIHQHEKPGTAPSPCTTTEEEDDSLESPLSPTSSVQSRDSGGGQRKKRREEVVQKVARKRTVCRSQFRHQNMELFKLGNSIPTSLCKTKEPYNVCAEKNLQMCYQNGGSKKSEKNPTRSSLTESIITTMEGAKKKDVPLWRSVSLNNEQSERQNTCANSNYAESQHSSSGRHILPAIVPELPERRRNRIKSLPESASKNVTDNNTEQKNKDAQEKVFEENSATHNMEHTEVCRKEPQTEQKHNDRIRDNSENTRLSEERRQSTLSAGTVEAKEVISRSVLQYLSSTEAQDTTESHFSNTNITSTVRRQSTSSTETQEIVMAHSQNLNRVSILGRPSTSSDSDINDYAPINLSLKNREGTNRHLQGDQVNSSLSKRNEVSNNQHLTQVIPRQPSNVPKKPQHLTDETTAPTNALDESVARAIVSEGAHVDKDGNCVFVASIPRNALDPQKQNNFIVINLPQMQQQMARMENPNNTDTPQTPADMLDGAIMSLVNIVKSSVESVFNIMSLPVLNRLYIDLNHYLVLPMVSAKLKFCIDEALSSLINYILANLFRTPRTAKMKSFVHKMMQLDLSQHMKFFTKSIDLIREKIRYDYFMEELLKVLSRGPQENFPGQFLRDGNRPLPPASRQYIPRQNQPLLPEFRDYARNNFWMGNSGYQHRKESVPPQDILGGISQSPPLKRSRRPTQEGHGGLQMDIRSPENFGPPNLGMMTPDLYLADNRCIPPNNPQISPGYFMQMPNQPRLKGRPKNLTKTNKTTAKALDNPVPLSLLPPQRDIFNRSLSNENHLPTGVQNREVRTKIAQNILNRNLNIPLDRNNDIASHTEATEENVRFANRLRLSEEKRLCEGALVASKAVESSGNLFNISNMQQIVHQEMLATTHKMWNDRMRNNNTGPFFDAHFAYAPLEAPPSVNIENSLVNKAHTSDNPSFPKNAGRKIPDMPLQGSSSGKAVIISNEVVRHGERNDVPNFKGPPAVVKEVQSPAAGNRAVELCTAPDVEQFLQTNIIVNKSQASSIIRGTVLENMASESDAGVIVSGEIKTPRIIEKISNTHKPVDDSRKSDTNSEKDSSFNLQLVSRAASSTIEDKNEKRGESKGSDTRPQGNAVVNVKTDSVIASTVIIKDDSMVVSKGIASSSENRGPSNAMDLDDVVLERVSPNGVSKEGIAYIPATGPKASDIPKQSTKENGHLEADVSIEKVTEGFDAPPKLIKLTSLKRKISQNDKQQKKKTKPALLQGEIATDEVVVIEDDEQNVETGKLDCNQNDVSKFDKLEKPDVKTNPQSDSQTKSVAIQENGSKTIDTKACPKKSAPPMIEDISSDEEVLESFRLYSTYENKVAEDPRKILQTTEVSHCTLIDGNVKVIQNANRHLFEKPPVYTRPVLPQKLRKLSSDADPESKKEPLVKMVRFEEDPDSLACSLNVKNNSEIKYPSAVDVRRFSPSTGYQISLEKVNQPPSPLFAVNFKLLPRPMQISPGRIQTSPNMPRPPIIQTSPGVPKPPIDQTSPVAVPNPPVVQTNPLSPGVPVVQKSPVAPMPHPLNESDMNWRHWFSDEQRKGVFNFERSQSMESSTLSGRQSAETPNSDYSPKFPPEEGYCEIKIDSKVCKIKKSLFERIPKGKLCYIRESNTFIRYFDDNQIELFISNLSLGEGSAAAKDLLKQVRGRTEGTPDVDTQQTQCEPSKKGEVITLGKDVVFSTEDFLSDPELYVEEVEKVQRYVPKDFYGFYKFVTGYQIVNHHPPISFQTFLTMHNTNGLRGLFKNYLNTLVEGRNVL